MRRETVGEVIERMRMREADMKNVGEEKGRGGGREPEEKE